jgi:hypothetical protein
MNEEFIRGQVNARDSVDEALAQSHRAVAFAVNMARTVGTLADAVQRVRELHARMSSDPGATCQGCARHYPCPTIRALDGTP